MGESMAPGRERDPGGSSRGGGSAQANGSHTNLIDGPLVSVKVKGQLGVVLLHDDPGVALDGLCADAPGTQSKRASSVSDRVTP